MNNDKTKTASAGAKNPTAAKYLKARPLAAQLGVSPKSIHRWAALGHIAARKVGVHTVLFDLSEVVAFIEKSKVE